MRHIVAVDDHPMLRDFNLHLLRTLNLQLQETHGRKVVQRQTITALAVSRQFEKLPDSWQSELLVRNGNAQVAT